MRVVDRVRRGEDGGTHPACSTVGADPRLHDPLPLDRRRFFRTTVPVRVNMSSALSPQVCIKKGLRENICLG